MSHVTRSDIYARDESGPEWWNEFLYSFSRSDVSCSEDKSSIQEILNAINNKRSETVESVVQDYCTQVGLDLVKSTDDGGDEQNIKQASLKRIISIRQEFPEMSFKPLSIRHASEKSIVDKIKSDTELVSALESLCKHSGGTKKIQSLITFLREKLGNEVSFSDDGLIQYLKEHKERFRENVTPDFNADHVGLVGTTDDSAEDHGDDIADYIKNDGAK